MSTQSKSAVAAALEHHFDSPSNYAHANNVADLVLESYGAGHAWLRPSAEPAEDDDARWTISAAGRDYLARLRVQEWLGLKS